MSVLATAAYAGFRQKSKKHDPGFDYGNGITSRKGDLRVGGKPYTDLGYEKTKRAYEYMSNWRHDDGRESSHARAEAEKLRQRMETLYPQWQQEQFQMRMEEYLAAMSEAMNREEPAQEPLKEAQEAMSAARADTDRKQLLRRGLMSTYTRYGQTGGTQRLGA